MAFNLLLKVKSLINNSLQFFDTENNTNKDEMKELKLNEDTFFIYVGLWDELNKKSVTGAKKELKEKINYWKEGLKMVPNDNGGVRPWFSREIKFEPAEYKPLIEELTNLMKLADKKISKMNLPEDEQSINALLDHRNEIEKFKEELAQAVETETNKEFS